MGDAMTETQAEQPHSRRNELFIAIIGLVGVLITGVFSNWDKLFPDPEIIHARSGYLPTGDFEKELRIYFELSGTRASLDSMQQQLFKNLESEEIRKHPEDATEIIKGISIAAKEVIRFEDVVKALLPVYQKHLSLEEIQELNRFYSTKTMQNMVNKLPLITQEAAPIQIQMMQEYMERLQKRIEVEIPEPN
jgi:hypothetical protein